MAGAGAFTCGILGAGIIAASSFDHFSMVPITLASLSFASAGDVARASLAAF